MGKKYYIVDAVCGHVGKNNGIIKSYAVYAKDGRHAASVARQIPRVKHDYKYAIRNVREVQFADYLIQIMINADDPYLNVRNRQEQNAFQEELQVIPMEEMDPPEIRAKKRRANLWLYDRKHPVDEYKAVC